MKKLLPQVPEYILSKGNSHAFEFIAKNISMEYLKHICNTISNGRANNDIEKILYREITDILYNDGSSIYNGTELYKLYQANLFFLEEFYKRTI